MKEKEKKKIINKVFKMSVIILFAIYITIFVSNKYGYFEYQKLKQVTLTQEQIKKFEEDVKNGINVEIEDYLDNVNVNYQTKLSQAGLDVSNVLSDTIEKGVNGFFGYINKLVEASE